MSDSLALWRTRARWFAAEFLVIVTGVLVALALNAIYQKRQDRRNEITYLALLRRDIGSTTAQLREKVAFEAGQVETGLKAYRALSAAAGTQDRAAVSANLSQLIDRRTMILRDATYQDLLSTGNLRLIRNRQLRDRIVDYYETTRGEYDIMNRNNSYLVDELYISVMVGRGLVKAVLGAGKTRLLEDVQARLTPLLRDGYIDEPDYLWSLPPGAPEWAVAKATLLSRIRISAVSEAFSRQVLARTEALSAALDAERNR